MAELLAGGVATGLYGYNRQNFLFDRTQQQHRVYWGQSMRMKQFELYREDVRDLIELTVAKMDCYSIIASLMLTFVIGLVTEGKPSPDIAPDWLSWQYSTSLAGATLYLVLALWLGVRASLAAQSYGTRMLTQHVRLPVPTREQINAARFKATEFEASQVGNMLRVPLVQQQVDELTSSIDDRHVGALPGEDGTPLWATPEETAAMDHTQLFRVLQANWQAYDAYSRVCLAVGTNYVIQGVNAYALCVLLCEQFAVYTCLGVLVVLSVSSLLIIELDLFSTRRAFAVATLLLLVPPITTYFIICVLMLEETTDLQKDWADRAACLIFMFQIAWIIFILFIACGVRNGRIALPLRFRSVLYLDVFGWISERKIRNQSEIPRVPTEAAEAVRAPGSPRPTSRGASSLPSMSLSSVQSAAASEAPVPTSSSASAAAPAGSEVPSLHQQSQQISSLTELCLRQERQLERDMQRWEHKDTAASIDSQWMLEEIKRLRAAFKSASEKLRKVAEPAAVQAALSAETEDSTPVWLKLEWNPSGTAMEFFFCVEANKTIWEPPQPPARISDLQLLEKQIETLDEKVANLKQAQPSRTAAQPTAAASGRSLLSVPAAAQGSRGSTTGGAPPLPPAPPPPVDTLQYDGTPSGSVQSSILSASPEVQVPGAVQQVTELSSRSQHPVEEQLTAPRSPRAEAEPLGVPKSISRSSLLSAAMLLANLDDEGDPDEARAIELGSVGPISPAVQEAAQRIEASGGSPETRRPAGLMPWFTFLYGSLLMLAVHCLGLVWHAARVLQPQIPPEGAQRLGVELLYKGPMPSAFFNPRGLACSPELEEELLLAESFFVHRVSLQDGGRSLRMERALDSCLSAASEFAAAGVRGISLWCSSGNCSAVLLGGGGNSILRCPLGPRARAIQSSVSGGPWKAIAAGSEESLWAVGPTANALVQLGPRGGGFAPQLELSRPGVGPSHPLAPATLVTIGETALVLEADGQLHSYPTGHSATLGSKARSWKLSLPQPLPGEERVQDLLWTGLCQATRDRLTFLSMDLSQRTVAFWSAKIPPAFLSKSLPLEQQGSEEF